MDRPDTAHLRLMASAGSGKTYRLVLRAVELLHAGEPLDAIVASTFTRNAAGEIRDRILARLCEAATTEEAAAALDADLRRHRTLPWASPATLDRARARSLLGDVARDIHRLQVRTLDGLFASIVQAFPAELGVAPDARILDEAEQQRLRGEAIADLLADQERGEATVRLLRTLTQGRADSGVDRAIDRLVQEAWSTWRESGGPEAWLTMSVPPGPDDEDVAAAVAALQAVAASKAYDTHHWRKWFAALPGRVAAGDWATLTRGGPAAKVIAEESTFGSRELGDDVLEPLQVLVDRARHELRRMHDERTRATAELCARYGVHHDLLKRAGGRLGFEDLSRLLVEGAPEDLERVAWRLDGRMHHLLLDEFQDTGIGQWEVLRPMAERLVDDASGHDRRSLFVVGDVKQSIYAWRSGRPEILENIPTLLLGEAAESIRDEPLVTSWRSAPVVLEAVNAIFGHLPDNPALTKSDEAIAAAAAWASRWEPHAAAPRPTGEELPGFVELRTGPERPDIADSNTRAARQGTDALGTAVARVRQWRAAMPDASIGVLVRRQAAAARILESLRRGSVPIQAIGPGGRPLVDEPAVTAVLSLLWLADHPGDLAAAFHVAESPLGPIAGIDFSAMRDPSRRRRTASEASARTRDRLARDGLAALLGDLVRRLAPHCDGPQLGRLRHLLEAAAEREADLGPRPSAFVAVARTLRAPEHGAGTVSVMTFHAAKGLEFDLVVTTDLGGTLSKPPEFLADRDPADGSVRRVTSWVAQADRWILGADERAAYVRTGTSSVRESLCMLYVAATRARHGLSIVVPAPVITKSAGTETFPKECLHHVLRGGLIGDRIPGPDEIAWTSGEETAVARWIARRSADRAVAAEAIAAAPAADAADAAPAADGDPRVAEAMTAAPRLRPGPPRRPRPISAAAASEAAEATVSLADRLRPSDREPRDRGTAIHALLESIEWLDGPSPREDGDVGHGRRRGRADGGGSAGAPARARAIGLIRRALPRATEEWAGRHADELPAILARPRIRELLSLAGRDPARVRVDNERPWVRAGAGGVQQGFIDRVVIEHDAGGGVTAATIVDWKTDHLDESADEGERRRHLARYAPQIETYRTVLAEATGLPADRIEAVLAFVTTGLVLRVPHEPGMPAAAAAAAAPDADAAAAASASAAAVAPGDPVDAHAAGRPEPPGAD